MLESNRIYGMDCLEGMKRIPDDMLDCCITDPPYGIRFMGRRWDYKIPEVEVWKEVLRIIKPGAYILVACGTRTQHRMVVNIEDAGFEIRDVICWHYGSGFPKSMDVNKAIHKSTGISFQKGELVRKQFVYADYLRRHEQIKNEVLQIRETIKRGRLWIGWGTSLKPATEFWTLARKPLGEKTIAANILRFGVGGLNIDDCRIYSKDAPGGIYTVSRLKTGSNLSKTGGSWRPVFRDAPLFTGVMKAGRFPANLILDEFSAQLIDEQSGILASGQPSGKRKAKNNVYGQYAPGQDVTGYGDEGGASRFFYVAKADAEERSTGNNHPTVKPLALMQYLIKLICPVESGRIVLDPFAGSGTTCIAARLLGIDYIAFEKNLEYVRIAERRERNELGLFSTANEKRGV